LKIYRVQIFIRLTLVFIHHPLPNVSITIRIPQRSLHSIFLALRLDAFAKELSWRSIEYRLSILYCITFQHDLIKKIVTSSLMSSYEYFQQKKSAIQRCIDFNNDFPAITGKSII
jgi:hypothetical protein